MTLGLVIWGSLSLVKLPIDAVPDITNNQVQVITVSPSLAAPEIERLITFPIEQANSNIPGIIEIRSFSRFGLSLVTIVFKDDVDIYWARQQISERLQLVRSQIPSDAGNPELAPVTTGLGEIFQYAVKPLKGFEDKYTPLELRTIQDWIIRRQLLGTPGVADVSSFGGYLRQFEVAIDPARLTSLNVTINDVFQALEANNQNTGGAYIEKGPAVLYIRSEGLAAGMDDIGSIAVKQTPAGIPVLIRDVAEVDIGHATRYGAMVYNDEGEVAGAVVMMLKGANSSRVIRDVKERIKTIQKSLPEGVVIEPFLDRTKMVNNAIGTVKKNLIEGALIVIFILVLFLGNLRAGLIVASVIPLAMLFAIIMMTLFGVSGNLMSLGALDFGLIVDGAVIIVEAVMHKLYHSGSKTSRLFTQSQMDHAVEDSSRKMMSAAVFGQIIILIVYLPILTLVGIEGKMFKPMAQTVSFALIGAFILSLTYVPMMSALFLSKKIRDHHTFSDKMMHWLENKYRPALEWSLRFPKILVIIAFSLFALSIWILSRMGGEFIPQLEEGDFAVDTRVLTGSSLTTTVNATTKTAGILLDSFPEVVKVVTKIGSGEIPTDPMPVEAADMMVILKDKKEWTSAKSFNELADKMSLALQKVPGVTTGFQYPVQMRFNELMTGARQDVVCKIFGEDLDSLANYSHQLGDIIRTVDGATDIYIETVTGLPQIVIRYNRSALAMYKVSIEEVNRVIRTAFAGESAGKIYENERRFDLVVRLAGDKRKTPEDVQQLLIPTPVGPPVPLYHLAAVEIIEGPNQIQREDAKRRIVVGFNVRGRDVQTIVNELEKKVIERIRMAPGYYITYGGAFENLVEARNRLAVAVPLALLLIFFMLYFAFGSFKYGLLIFTAIPLSAIGGIIALWIRDMPFSISAGIGFIALFGVAVLNGIVLIAEFNRLKNSGEIADIKTVIMEGTRMRLRPVLMTAAVASLGFLPMALSKGAGAEVQRPLATVVIGGLVSATFLTLLLLPVLYNWFARVRTKRNGNLPTAVIVSLGMLLSLNAGAQVDTARFTLQQMMETGKIRHLSLKAQQKQVDFWEQMKRSAFDPGRTQLDMEYGNVNSAQTDTRFGITQGFSLPVVYRRQAKWFEANRVAESSQVLLKEKDLKRDIGFGYASLVDMMERRKLLMDLDTIFSGFYSRAAIRLEAGETNLLEKTSAEAQLQQLRLQLVQLEADMVTTQQLMRFLLDTGAYVLPVYSSPQLAFNAFPDSSQLIAHPSLVWHRNLIEIAQRNADLEKNQLLPSFYLGYANQSFKGWQSKDGNTQEYLSGSDRFHIAQGGIGIPLFSGAARARVKAAMRKAEGAELTASLQEKMMFSRYSQLMEQLKKNRSALDYFTKTGLEHASIIIRQAELNIQKGQIDFLQWSMLMNQAFSIRLSWLDALKNYNDAVIELQYYLPETP